MGAKLSHSCIRLQNALEARPHCVERGDVQCSRMKPFF